MGIISGIMGVDNSQIQTSSQIKANINVTDIRAVRQYVERGVQQNSVLQPAVTSKGVMQAAHKAGEAERRALFFSKYATQKQRESTALLSQLKTGVAHAKFNLGMKEQIQAVLADLGMAQMDHQVNSGIQQNHYQGHFDMVAGSGFDGIG
jgi:hypothetical protein